MRIFGLTGTGKKAHEIYPLCRTLSYCSVTLPKQNQWSAEEPPADLCKNCKRAREAHR